MAFERRSAAFYTNAAQLDALPGPLTVKFAILEDTLRVYKWIVGDTTAADGISSIAHTGGYTGRWLLLLGAATGSQGADLDNTATQQIFAADGSIREIPLATLTENVTLDFMAFGAVDGSTVRIVRYDVSAFTVTLNDNGAAAQIGNPMPAFQQWWADVRWDSDGSVWKLVGAGQLM